MSLDFSTITAPFRMQPGLRKLAPGAAQLTPMAPDGTVFREKFAVLAEPNTAKQALVSVDGFDATPALRALCRQAAAEHPDAFVDSARDFTSLPLGWRVSHRDGHLQALPHAHINSGQCLSALPAPWRLAALLCLSLHEDFAIVDGASATSPWLAVCLPSHWAPTQKVGRHFTEVHAPVTDNTTLLAAAAHLMALVCEPPRWERFVWTITTHARRDQHPQRHARLPWPVDADANTLAALAWLRSERQSFIPLPQLRQAVFTIHVEVQPLAQAVATREQAQRLHDALASMSDAVLAYRGLTDARDRLVGWLAERCGT